MELPSSPFLYPIIDSNFSTDILSDVQRALDAGAKIVQIRAKTLPALDFYHLACNAEKICELHGVPLILNDRSDIALLLENAGVHLGQEDFPAAELRKLLPERIIGLSTHNMSEFLLARQLPLDYISIGPINETSTKEDARPVVGISFLKQVRPMTDRPLICIGGIHEEHFEELIRAGADGIAVISELCSENNVFDSTRRLLRRMEKIGARL